MSDFAQGRLRTNYLRTGMHSCCRASPSWSSHRELHSQHINAIFWALMQKRKALNWLVAADFSCWRSRRGRCPTFTRTSPIWTEMRSRSSPKLRYVIMCKQIKVAPPFLGDFSNYDAFFNHCRNHSGRFSRYSTPQRATFISWWHSWTAEVWIR